MITLMMNKRCGVICIKCTQLPHDLKDLVFSFLSHKYLSDFEEV